MVPIATLMSPVDFDPKHDLVHTPDPERERWRESYYFQFIDFKLGIGGYHGPGYRPVKGYSGVLNVLWGLDVPTLVATEKGRYTTHDAVHPVGGLQWDILEPLKRWRIRFDGRLNDGGGDPAIPVEAVTSAAEASGRLVDAAFDLIFERDQPAYLYREDPRWDGLFDGHIDEVGRVTGSLRMGEKTYEIDGRGSKDHSWGVRDWGKPRGWRWVDMLFEDGPELTVWRATFDGTNWLDDGAIYVDGTAEPVTAFSESVTFAPRPRADRPDLWEFDVRSENHVVRGRAEILRVVPLLFGFRDEDGNRGTMWNDRTVFRCETEDGRIGYGSAEFQFRAPEDGSKAPRPLIAGVTSA
jgi:hypothetical protein